MTVVKHILTDVDVAGVEHLIVIAALRDIVVHVELPQVLTVLECSIMDYHLESCVGIFRCRCAVLEHHLLDVLIAAQCGTVNGNGLVVVGSTYVVVDAHLALSAVELVIVYASDLHIPGLGTIRCRGEQLVDVKVAVLGSPRLYQQLHLVHATARELVAKVAVLHTSGLFCFLQVVLVRCHNLVGILAPIGVGKEHLIHLSIHHNAEILVTTVKHIASDVHIRRQQHVVVVGSVGDEVIHIELLQVATVLEGTVVYHHLELRVGVG